jgi:signal transduction histidine kinase
MRARVALAAAALATGVAIVALSFGYLATQAWLIYEADAELRIELDELIAYDLRNAEALLREVQRRAARKESGVYIYCNAEYVPMAGTVDYWPERLADVSDGDDLELESDDGMMHVRIAARMLEGGRHLAVGRDMTGELHFAEVFRTTAIGAFFVAMVLAIGSGLAVSRGLLGRIQGMNRTILRILSGRKEERVPISEMGDEFDVLATHFNRLLDENDRLVARMREVTNDVAHDLRTPLSRMRTHIESALGSQPDATDTENTLRSVLAETDRVLETFNALLRIAQIESGTLREEMEPLDLAGLAREAVELYQPAADEALLALEADLAADLVVRGNRHLLAQALTNLLDNAIKYAGDGGRVRVLAQPRQGRAALGVEDGGPGIPAADQRRVLERFVRLGTARDQPGTGLGLSFVAAVADLHGAELLLEDVGPGLRVTLLFPAAD